MRKFTTQLNLLFKTRSTKKLNLLRGTPGQKVWQRGYYDRIIRNQAELDRIRKYIQENPLKWGLDPYHPSQYASEASHS